MNQYDPTPEETRKQLEDAARELDEHAKRNPPPQVPPEEDDVPTHFIDEEQPAPQQVIDEEQLGPKNE